MNARQLQSVILGLVLFLSVSLFMVAHADNIRSGQWMIEPCNDNTGRLQLTLRYNERGEHERNDGWGNWGSTQSHSIGLDSLSGLTDADLKSAGKQVKFSVVHDAGSLQSEGW